MVVALWVASISTLISLAINAFSAYLYLNGLDVGTLAIIASIVCALPGNLLVACLLYDELTRERKWKKRNAEALRLFDEVVRSPVTWPGHPLASK